MSSEESVALALRHYQECTPDEGDPEKQRALQVVDEILSPDFTMYFSGDADAEASHGRTSTRSSWYGIRAFPWGALDGRGDGGGRADRGMPVAL